MVIVLEAHAAVTPAGKPVAVPIPVAPVVVWVILVKAVLLLTVGLELAAEAVLSEVKVIVELALVALSHPVTVCDAYKVALFVNPVVVDNAEPPLDASYHLIELPVAVKFDTVGDVEEQKLSACIIPYCYRCSSTYVL